MKEQIAKKDPLKKELTNVKNKMVSYFHTLVKYLTPIKKIPLIKVILL